MHPFNTHEREQVCELLKREATQLTRLRHPSILEVVEPVDESRTAIAFATEPLMATVGDLVHGRRRGQVSDDGEPFELDELEIQKGLIQVAKGLQFCHQDAKLAHGNLNPEAIFVNGKGDWKLGGFAFSTFTNRPAGALGNELSVAELEDMLPDACLPNRDYMAPERAFDRRVDLSGDMFSLGALIHAIYYKGEPPARAGRTNNAHSAAIDAIEKKSLEQIPASLRLMVHQMLSKQAEQRPSAAAFQQSSYFDNLLVSTIRFLETFCEKSRDQKIQFLKGLPRVLPQFPDRALKKKILTLLLEEIKDHTILPLILPNVLSISEKLSATDFTNRVLPALKPLFSIKEPAAAVVALLDKTSVLQKKTTPATFKEEVLPLVVNALDSTIPLVQERALKVLPTVAETLDYTVVKNSVFPKTQSLFCTTNVLSVKVNTLICFHAMLKTLDKFTIVERLLPMLRQAGSREPAVIMASLVLYDEVGRNQLDKEQVASEVLPELWRMCMDPGLNLAQFKKFMKAIRELTDKIEEMQAKHLGEMKRLDDSTRASANASPGLGTGRVGAVTTLANICLLLTLPDDQLQALRRFPWATLSSFFPVAAVAPVAMPHAFPLMRRHLQAQPPPPPPLLLLLLLLRSLHLPWPVSLQRMTSSVVSCLVPARYGCLTDGPGLNVNAWCLHECTGPITQIGQCEGGGYTG
ncbi:kinase-like domain-containing protein [Thamnocephalis sphaerospora]|uniref:Kinase-like domain-containing protein n=1 Tax=Thamnocephalis sphaerospora TaxID=78915 RepID=A0A4P9XLB2_9FUNG|nr:kinase-like domain-containing protein [Thamnocephalis sphaerospora]|eukprot:RKP06151.1 kinase-like domain-containing protein [Thamnocephalis sphaerospora]